MKQNKTLSMLSIAAKAGKVASGGFLVEKSLQEYKAKVVLIAEDASDNTKKKFIQKCDFYKVPCYISENSTVLGNSIADHSVFVQIFVAQVITLFQRLCYNQTIKKSKGAYKYGRHDAQNDPGGPEKERDHSGPHSPIQ